MSTESSDQRAEAMRHYQAHRAEYLAADERYRQACARVAAEDNGVRINGSHRPCDCGEHGNALNCARAERDAAYAALKALGHPHKGSDRVAAIDRASARQEAVAELDERIAAMQAHRDKVAGDG